MTLAPGLSDLGGGLLRARVGSALQWGSFTSSPPQLSIQVQPDTSDLVVEECRRLSGPSEDWPWP